ncbi:uncharacterized protein LOC129580913 [Paramacrobiotus metropolitanus]|uniref:uncharacterized protein LOC129580913 n=1 Tax=Paramacrobiotus metropolitanus TaxID=2943436 RepID=UPI00244560E1|nr:uncharacterized protein LOC129580913 [Paramacrobiotus metropolitanus]XP_055327650.1 uncharacterized protein LOC129580913 [Paramacrobiotus metropolitanus]
METSREQHPSTCTTQYWLYEMDERFHYTECDGKWMYFFPRSVIDDRWKEAVELYNAGKLPGIASMKVSTAVPNPRASSSSHVLIFYCGPPNNEARVKEIGRKLVAAFPPPTKIIYYKSDEQTEGGTRATGQKKNSKYSLTDCVVRPNQVRARDVPSKDGEEAKNSTGATRSLEGAPKANAVRDDENDDIVFIQDVKKAKTN